MLNNVGKQRRSNTFKCVKMKETVNSNFIELRKKFRKKSLFLEF